MKVIAVGGWKQNGKDTLADHLVSKYHAQRVSFAGPLKDAVARDYNIPRSWCDDPEFKEKPILTMPVNPKDGFSLVVCRFMVKEFRDDGGRQPLHWASDGDFIGAFDDGSYAHLYHTPRSLCILEGSTKRAADPGYWVNKAIFDISNKASNMPIDQWKKNIQVITDMRYKSEADQLKKGFRDQVITVRVNRFDTSLSVDPSERDLDDYKFDHVIENRGTLEEFYSKIDDLMGKL